MQKCKSDVDFFYSKLINSCCRKFLGMWLESCKMRFRKFWNKIMIWEWPPKGGYSSPINSIFASTVRGGEKEEKFSRATLNLSSRRNHLCHQPSGNCLTATSGLANNLGLGRSFCAFCAICPLTRPMPSLSVNPILSNWTRVPYRTKIRLTKLSKFWLGVENFVRRKI